jgi:hypothetical protein
MIHIPRTGGGAIEQAYAGESYYQNLTYHPHRYLRSHDFDCNAKLTTMGHFLPDTLLRCGVDKCWMQNYFTFSFVRNPWDRLVSLFFYYRRFRLHRRRHDSGSNLLLKDFHSFIREICNPKSQWFNIRPVSMSFIYAQPQMYWLDYKMDFIGRFENLESDWKKLCSMIGIPNKVLPKHNATTHENYRNYYDAELRELVAFRYAKTIEQFNYQF